MKELNVVDDDDLSITLDIHKQDTVITLATTSHIGWPLIELAIVIRYCINWNMVLSTGGGVEGVLVGNNTCEKTFY